ncbi:hypothetical protein [Natronorubrum halophilum]|uniref:hypothetical protein n=1 Tax=Natronorubrum halophilum TaxID=1702106 RepID=UPI000EF6FE4A|nr:hypothetical protein [Natronorubrum halophilum]
MKTVDRCQYPWIALAATAFGLAIAGYLLEGVSVVSLYPLTGGFGLLIVVSRPKAFGYVMAGLGIVSLVVAGLPADWSPLTRGVLVVVGIGSLVGGVRSLSSVAANR